MAVPRSPTCNLTASAAPIPGANALSLMVRMPRRDLPGNAASMINGSTSQVVSRSIRRDSLDWTL
ncbi:hypothetical protein [Phreatobacter sp.]|uniref:hypothetical protein n=1 Tax=Phreatobacter sp. TaxID=1966341 RepID=UPI0025F1BEDB|nr:hypothetical protein [Phreatobacter sp.]